MTASIMAEPLVEETRAGITECIHQGMISIVTPDGPLYGLGSPDWLCFYRSAAKPIQSLPIFLLHLDRQYGLTDEEAAFLSGSHWGDAEHERVCRSILQKADLNPDDMIMQPAYPTRLDRREEMIRRNMPPQRIYHNCAGKHLALMMLARELHEPVKEYWKQESHTQKTVREIIASMSSMPYEDVAVGIDGCGVPVFAVPFVDIAQAYMKLACPELIPDADVRTAVQKSMNCIHKYPSMIAGRNVIDSILTENTDLIAKSGAKGVYAIGVRSQRIGIVFKILDGSQDDFACIAAEILTQLKVAPEAVSAVRAVYQDTVVNDQQMIVGKRNPLFDLNAMQRIR